MKFLWRDVSTTSEAKTYWWVTRHPTNQPTVNQPIGEIVSVAAEEAVIAYYDVCLGLYCMAICYNIWVLPFDSAVKPLRYVGSCDRI